MCSWGSPLPCSSPRAGAAVRAALTPSSMRGQGDAGTPDAGAADGGARGDAGCVTNQPPAFTPDVNQKKFALSMYHFNVQYVAGGLDVMLKDGTNAVFGEMSKGWTEEKLDRWYITQPFDATLDLYLAHPAWKTDFELQGRLLELIVNGYPKVLEKLKALAENGQLETISIHYSDQLFVAFPRADLQKSADITKAIFDGACVPLSGVVFNQEGETGVGKHDFMAKNGYTIDIFPTNLWLYYHQVARAPTIQEPRRRRRRAGRGLWQRPAAGLRTFDPGIGSPGHTSTTATMAFPLDPYFAPMSSPDLIRRTSPGTSQLVALSRRVTRSPGRRLRGHRRWASTARSAAGSTARGSRSTRSRSGAGWAAARSSRNAKTERDNTVAPKHRTRTDRAAARRFRPREGRWGATALEPEWILAWKNHARQVTDATDHAVMASSTDRAHRSAAAAAAVVILGALRRSAAREDRPDGGAAGSTRSVGDKIPPADAPFGSHSGASRTSGMNWPRRGGAYMLMLTFGPAADPTGEDADNCKVTLTFPRHEDKYQYSALPTTGRPADMSLFTYQAPDGLPAARQWPHRPGNGWWVVKDCSRVHIGADRTRRQGRPVRRRHADPVTGRPGALRRGGRRLAALDAPNQHRPVVQVVGGLPPCRPTIVIAQTFMNGSRRGCVSPYFGSGWRLSARPWSTSTSRRSSGAPGADRVPSTSATVDLRVSPVAVVNRRSRPSAFPRSEMCVLVRHETDRTVVVSIMLVSCGDRRCRLRHRSVLALVVVTSAPSIVELNSAVRERAGATAETRSFLPSFRDLGVVTMASGAVAHAAQSKRAGAR